MLLVVFQIGYTFAESAAVWWSAAFVRSSPRESSAAAELIGVPSTGVIVIVAGVLGDMFGVHAAGKGPYTLPRLCYQSPGCHKCTIEIKEHAEKFQRYRAIIG